MWFSQFYWTNKVFHLSFYVLYDIFNEVELEVFRFVNQKMKGNWNYIVIQLKQLFNHFYIRFYGRVGIFQRSLFSVSAFPSNFLNLNCTQ